MRKRAFTLVELLVVIGIIAVLIGVLLPARNKARAQANLTVGMSNLRSIGQAIQMYTVHQKGVLPYGYWDGSPPNSNVYDSQRAGEWSLLLLNLFSNKYDTNYTGHAQTAGETARLREVFKDTDTAPGKGIIHYSAHPRLMPNLDDPDWSVPGSSFANGPWLKPYKVSKIKRAAEVVLVMDGTQVKVIAPNQDAWGAMATAFRADNSALYSIDHPPTPSRRTYMLYDHRNATNGEMIDGGINKDVEFQSSPGAGDIRWRHQKNTRANFLFCDGHVETRAYKSRFQVDLKKLNFNVNK